MASDAARGMAGLKLGMSHCRLEEAIIEWVNALKLFEESARRANTILSDTDRQALRRSQPIVEKLEEAAATIEALEKWDGVDLLVELDNAIATLEPSAPMHARLERLRKELDTLLSGAKVELASAALAM